MAIGFLFSACMIEAGLFGGPYLHHVDLGHRQKESPALTLSAYSPAADSPTGANSRHHVLELLASPAVSAVIGDQAQVLTAAHAYAVERSIPVIRDRRIVDRNRRAS